MLSAPILYPNMLAMIDRDITGPIAWRGADLGADPGRIRIEADAMAEIDALAVDLDTNPLPMTALRPGDFDLPRLSALMARVSHELEDGHGFVILDRLPIERLAPDTARAIYWLLGSMIARPVAQKWDGTMIYDVRDTGRPPGNGVRPDQTNAEQNFHTDNSYNHCSPAYVGLLCMRTAKSGGVSHIVSFAAAHNELRRRHGDLLPRLYQPFHFDRQREHAPDDVMTTWHAMFEDHAGRLRARLSRFQVVNGYKLAGATLDAEGAAAIAALEEVMNAPDMGVDFHFKLGEMQFLDNRRIGHRRTGFEDWPEPERKRLLVRLWLRDEGRPFYNG
jgi:alpha-ketoglutarate-dependent taurine dioxygenase